MLLQGRSHFSIPFSHAGIQTDANMYSSLISNFVVVIGVTEPRNENVSFVCYC
jgi:hypothetical protein